MRNERNSGSPGGAESLQTLQVSSFDPGQRYPHHYPHRKDFEDMEDDPLGEPMTIEEVARFLRCSAWTVRQRHLRFGLPHFRLGRGGKLLFYRKQVVQWILEKQKAQRGGE